MRVLIDVDQVCADLHTPWLARYRRLSGHELYPEQVTNWDIDQLVREDWKEAIFGLLTPSIYDEVRPIPMAAASVSILRDAGHEVVFVSSCHSHEKAIRKQKWLRDWGFAGDDGDLLFIATKNKYEVHGDVLVDDHLVNIEAFPGAKVLFDAPYNRAPRYWHNGYRVKDWMGAMAALNMIRSDLERSLIPGGDPT